MLDTLLTIFWILLGICTASYVVFRVAKVLTDVGEGVRYGVRRAKVGSRMKSFKAGKCFHCGYDLRANTHRCPECGHHIPIRPIF